MTVRDTVDTDPAPAAHAAEAGSRHAHPVLVVLGASLLLLVLVRALLVQSYYVSSGAMRPTLAAGDRVLLTPLGSPGRGDLVLVDGTAAFGGPDLTPHRDTGLLGRTLSAATSALGLDLGEKDYVLRVIGVGGDHVTCCTASGQVSVDGTDLAEPYLATGAAHDETPFDVTVPAGRLFVLGDDRATAVDSRTHPASGDGTVSTGDVVGRVVARFWPPTRLGTLAPPGLRAGS